MAEMSHWGNFHSLRCNNKTHTHNCMHTGISTSLISVLIGPAVQILSFFTLPLKKVMHMKYFWVFSFLFQPTLDFAAFFLFLWTRANDKWPRINVRGSFWGGTGWKLGSIRAAKSVMGFYEEVVHVGGCLGAGVFYKTQRIFLLK